MPVMMPPIFCPGRIALENQRQSDVLKAEQLAKECETNPTLRHAMQLEAQRKQIQKHR